MKFFRKKRNKIKELKREIEREIEDLKDDVRDLKTLTMINSEIMDLYHDYYILPQNYGITINNEFYFLEQAREVLKKEGYEYIKNFKGHGELWIKR